MFGIRVRATPSVFKTCWFGSAKQFWPRIFGQDGMDGIKPCKLRQAPPEFPSKLKKTNDTVTKLSSNSGDPLSASDSIK